ncbi:YrhK family protein [Pseudarthrobacter sp. PS3-L1]|uniref:YrhK family protein n=1 Tax=Pseudarthrobacter sp. PS3-L1 TaxID=3046207 RepID=UPI0024BB1569|nr:YrhK family protein [Pseudarthrobacter sp. PS3-L1]MDJ0320584.1 YrhK family protein [Pseudarthrobacter sp. PS3-L1]
MPKDLDLNLGGKELVLHNRYETLSILNDVMIALWFIAGSILFFNESSTITGTWLFLAGSVELLIRPVIRLTRNIHLTTVSRNVNSNDY